MTVLTGLLIILVLAAAAALAVLGRIAALAEILPLRSMQVEERHGEAVSRRRVRTVYPP
jgi:hypothetical protein